MSNVRSTDIISTTVAEPLIGSVAAAKLLGVHRSAINYAVKHQYLMPDARTPKGQYRFKPATIRLYGANMRAHQTAGGSGALADDRTATSGAWLDLLHRLTIELASGTDANEICKQALVGIRQLQPDMRLGVVVRHDPTDGDPLHASPIASEGLTREIIDQVSRLGRATEFAFRAALQSGETLRCDDTTAATLLSGSRVFIDRLHILSYRMCPLRVRSLPTGVLIILCTTANAFSPVADTFLDQIADLLAAAIMANHRMTKLRDALTYAADLMTRGVEEYAVGGAATPERLEQLLVDMAQTYCETTQAYTVICTAGPPAPGMEQDERVRALAESAARSRVVELDDWPTERGRVMAIATPVPLGGGIFAGMAAAWRAERGSWDADIDVLRIFTAACILALSGLHRGHPPGDTSGSG